MATAQQGPGDAITITVQSKWRMPEQTVTMYTDEALSLFSVLREVLGVPIAADLQTQQQLAWAGALIRKLYNAWEPHSDLHRLLAPGGHRRVIQQLTDEEEALLAKVLRYEI